jgi:hypothetical protein
VEILGLTEGKHPVHKRQVGEQLGPRHYGNDFAVRVSFLHYLKEGGKENVFPPPPLALTYDVLLVRHWLLLCNVILG